MEGATVAKGMIARRVREEARKLGVGVEEYLVSSSPRA